MTTERQSDDRRILDHLKIFPLPEAVLFPSTLLPLHIFEPRYRTMVRDALEGDGLIGIGMIDAMAASRDGTIPVCQTLGVGKIREHAELPDDHRVIVLQGMLRARILEELEVITPYRQVRAEQLDDSLSDSTRAERLVRSIQGCLRSLHQRGIDGADDLAGLIDVLAPGQVGDVIASSIYDDPDERQSFLEDLDVIHRLEAVESRLEFLVHEVYLDAPPDRRDLN